MEDVFYWLTVKRAMSHDVSLYQDMRFFIGFPITINKPQILSWIQLESLKTMNILWILCFSSKPDISLSPMTMVKSHRKKQQNYFRVTTLSVADVEKRLINTEASIQLRKKMMNLDYCEKYQYIKQNIIMTMLRKAK